MNRCDLVLASASPRRRELLAQLGASFSVQPADIDETVRAGEAAEDYVVRMAREKAAAVAAAMRGDDWAVLGADTTVVLDGEALGKPRDASDAVAMLLRLAARSHDVFTAIALHHAGGQHELLVCTEVDFLPLDRAQCEAYVASGEPMDKAGAYGIQGLGGAFVSGIRGSYSNVVGLPLCETWQLLRSRGIATGLDAPAKGD